MSTIFTSNLVILKLFQQIVFNNYLINQLHFYIENRLLFVWTIQKKEIPFLELSKNIFKFSFVNDFESALLPVFMCIFFLKSKKFCYYEIYLRSTLESCMKSFHLFWRTNTINWFSNTKDDYHRKKKLLTSNEL